MNKDTNQIILIPPSKGFNKAACLEHKVESCENHEILIYFL